MPTVFAANESTVTVNGVPVEGVVSLEYQRSQVRSSLYALGSAQRIAMVSGPAAVEGRLTVASTSADLDKLDPEASFQIIANLKRGKTTMTVTLDECYLTDKSFAVSVGDHGQAVYAFSATTIVEK